MKRKNNPGRPLRPVKIDQLRETRGGIGSWPTPEVYLLTLRG